MSEHHWQLLVAGYLIAIAFMYDFNVKLARINEKLEILIGLSDRSRL